MRKTIQQILFGLFLLTSTCSSKELSVYFCDTEVYEEHSHTEILHIPTVIQDLRENGASHQGFDFSLRMYFHQVKDNETRIPNEVLSASIPLLKSVLRNPADIEPVNLRNYLSVAANHRRTAMELEPEVLAIALNENYNSLIRQDALYAFGMLSDGTSCPKIEKLMASENGDLRFMAAWAYLKASDKEPSANVWEILTKGFEIETWPLAYNIFMDSDTIPRNVRSDVLRILEKGTVAIPKDYVERLERRWNQPEFSRGKKREGSLIRP